MAANVDGFYESDKLGAIILVRLRAAEGAAYTPAVPAVGAETLDLHAFNGASRRRFGVHARGLKLTRVVGTGAEATKKRTFLPVGTVVALAGFKKDDEVSIGGVAWQVSGKVDETIV